MDGYRPIPGVRPGLARVWITLHFAHADQTMRKKIIGGRGLQGLQHKGCGERIAAIATTSHIRSVSIAMAFAVSCFGITNATAQTGKSRNLSVDEQQSATSRAMTDLGIGSAPAGASNRRSLRAADTANRYEMLLTERRPVAKNERRRLADIYVYDYAENKLLHRVVDTGTGDIVHRATFTDHQLPLTEAESNRAIGILAADQDARSFLNEEYARISGGLEFDLSNVDYKAATYIAEHNVQGITAQCGQIRCAEILIYTADNKIALDLRPVVDLSTGSVLSVETIHWGSH